MAQKGTTLRAVRVVLEIASVLRVVVPSHRMDCPQRPEEAHAYIQTAPPRQGSISKYDNIERDRQADKRMVQGEGEREEGEASRREGKCGGCVLIVMLCMSQHKSKTAAVKIRFEESVLRKQAGALSNQGAKSSAQIITNTCYHPKRDERLC